MTDRQRERLKKGDREKERVSKRSNEILYGDIKYREYKEMERDSK